MRSSLRAVSLMVGLAFSVLLVSPVSAEKPTTLYTTVTKVATATSTQTGATLWTPASGYRFIIQGVFVSSTEAIDVSLQVSGVNVVAPIHLESPGSKTITAGGVPIYIGAKDAVLTWSTSTVNRGQYNGHGDVSIMVWGWEDQF